MNILPKKRWHVRTKENMARVRRDEAEAARKEEERLQRVKLAEQERRMVQLKERKHDDVQPSSSAQCESTSAHINFFSELEEQERKNTSGGNKEYMAEKKNEQHEWESKMGIMKKFAEDTMELSGGAHWWETIDRVKPETNITPDSTINKECKSVKGKGKKHHRKRRRRSTSSDDEDERKKRLEKLRAERVRREQAERARAQQLLRH